MEKNNKSQVLKPVSFYHQIFHLNQLDTTSRSENNKPFTLPHNVEKIRVVPVRGPRTGYCSFLFRVPVVSLTPSQSKWFTIFSWIVSLLGFRWVLRLKPPKIPDVTLSSHDWPDVRQNLCRGEFFSILSHLSVNFRLHFRTGPCNRTLFSHRLHY